MEEGPPHSAFRSWEQTTLSCSEGNVWVVSVREKAELNSSCVVCEDERKRTVDEVSKIS